MDPLHHPVDTSDCLQQGEVEFNSTPVDGTL